MTAYYIGQHDIGDEPAFAAYLKETMPFIEKHGGRYLTKAGSTRCSKAKSRAAS